MGKKKKNKGNGAAPAGAPTAQEAPAAATPAAPAAKPAERTLMDTLEPDTTPAQIFMMVGAMLAFPIVLSFIVKYALLPAVFPSFR